MGSAKNKTSLRPTTTAGVLLLTLAWLSGPSQVCSQMADSFSPGASWDVEALALQADGKVLVGGIFDKLGGQPRKGLGRVNPDGSLDVGFKPAGLLNFNGALAVQTTGTIWASGYFWLGRWNVPFARLNENGNPDTNYNSGANSTVQAILEQSDGKILVGGYFTAMGGQPRNHIARLNSDGSLDQEFDPGTDGVVYCLALQSDGKIVVGGKFTVMAGGLRDNLGRLYPDGSLDWEYDPSPEAQIRCMAVQSDDKLVVSGSFRQLAGQPCQGFGRVGVDGTLDTDFNKNRDCFASSMALQADGKVLLAGELMDWDTRRDCHISRVNSDGSVDLSFCSTVNFVVSSLALQGDGRIVVGGWYEQLAGAARTNIGRLYNTQPAQESLTYDGTAIRWLRSGTSPEVAWTTFAWSTNSTNWTELGPGQRIPGGWQLADTIVPAGATVRGRGVVSGGYYNGSSWYVESQTVVGRPLILISDGRLGFTGGQFGFTLNGIPGTKVAIETSADLTQWRILSTNSFSSNRLSFVDESLPSLTGRFYRARVLP